MLACLFMRRLATHSTTVAPELSMQFSIVYSIVSQDDPNCEYFPEISNTLSWIMMRMQARGPQKRSSKPDDA